jgi:hypothetical protein
MIARTSYNTRRQSIALKEYYSAHLGTLPPCGEARAEGVHRSTVVALFITVLHCDIEKF